MTKKPWETKEWIIKRDEFIKDKICEWCGSDKNLCVHHKIQIMSYATQLKLFSIELLYYCIEKGEFKEEVLSKNVCPKCEYKQFRERTTMKPMYKCYHCGFEFDSPKIINFTIAGRISRLDWNIYWSKYGDKIRERVLKERDESYKKYINFDDCIVLCNRCHLAYHKGMKLCPICKKKYTTNHYNSCFDCFSKTDKGKEVKSKLVKENEIIDITLPCGYITKMRRIIYENEIACGEINCPKGIYFGDCEDFIKDNNKIYEGINKND